MWISRNVGEQRKSVSGIGGTEIAQNQVIGGSEDPALGSQQKSRVAEPTQPGKIK
jgi:hypothetical protein